MKSAQLGLAPIIREVPDAPFMTSYNERSRSDGLAVGYLLYGTRVVFDNKQVVHAVHVGVDGRRGAALSVGDNGHTVERRHDESPPCNFLRCNNARDESMYKCSIDLTKSRSFIYQLT